MSGCRHSLTTAPAGTARLPGDWQTLAGEPAPFAAMYRLECCGQRRLVAVVRADGHAVRVSVAAPPAGVVLEGWLAGGDAAITRTGGRCVERLPGGRLPLTGDTTLPLDPHLTALLLAGRVPAAAVALAGRPGWVGVEEGGLRLAWRVVGDPVRCDAVEVARVERETPLLRGELSDHHGRVPGRLRLESEGARVALELVEWHSAAAPEPPRWLAAPACPEGG